VHYHSGRGCPMGEDEAAPWLRCSLPQLAACSAARAAAVDLRAWAGLAGGRALPCEDLREGLTSDSRASRPPKFASQDPRWSAGAMLPGGE